MMQAPASLREKFKPGKMKATMRGPAKPNSGGGFGGAAKGLGKAMGGIFGKKPSAPAGKGKSGAIFAAKGKVA